MSIIKKILPRLLIELTAVICAIGLGSSAFIGKADASLRQCGREKAEGERVASEAAAAGDQVEQA